MKIFEILARSKSIEILLALKEKNLKFNEIVKVAGNSTTAMRRVKDLQNVGLVSRKELHDKAGSVEYSLTEKGVKVVGIIEDTKKLS